MGARCALAQSCPWSYPFTTPAQSERRLTLDSAHAHHGKTDNEAVVHQLPAIVFETDAAGRLRFVSDAWHRTVGEPADQLIGQPATVLVRPEDAGIMREQFETAVRLGLEPASAIVSLAGPQPARVHRLRSRPARRAEQLTGGVVGLLADVTDHERREAVLRQGERLASLGTLLATAAHELNNPLAAISGFSQLLLASPRAMDTREALEMIHHEASRAARTVRDLLGFSRARQAEQRTAVDLNAVVTHVVATRRYALETRGIACEVRLDASLPCVLGERSQLEQLVLALIVNAEQVLAPLTDRAAGAGASASLRLTIGSRVEGQRVYLEVADTGPGISPDDLARIWEPFWTTKPEGEGTGLGLAIAHGIVESHGGTIEVESAEGEGSRFTIGLPSCEAATSGPSDPGHSTRPLDVLIVGRAETLDFLARYLTSRGHAVLTARSAKRAVRLAGQVPVDVVICEVQRREAGALELVRELRSSGGSRAPRIVFATQHRPTPVARERLADAGAAAILTTPYEIEAVRMAVEG